MRDDDALDAVLAAAPREFVATRDRVAAELKQAGDREGAARVRALRRPPPGVWAINQLARRDPDAIAALLDGGAQLVAAERRAMAGEAGTFLADARAERQRVAALARRAGGILATAGQRASAATARRISQTLHAAAIGDPEAREALRAGRLTAELEPPGGFGAAPSSPSPPPAARGAAASRRASAAGNKRATVPAAARKHIGVATDKHIATAAPDSKQARAEAIAAKRRARAEAAAAKKRARAEAAAAKSRARAEAATVRKRHAARQRAAAAADRAVATQRRAVEQARAEVERAEQRLRAAKDALAQAELAAQAARRDDE